MGLRIEIWWLQHVGLGFTFNIRSEHTKTTGELPVVSFILLYYTKNVCTNQLTTQAKPTNAIPPKMINNVSTHDFNLHFFICKSSLFMLA